MRLPTLADFRTRVSQISKQYEQITKLQTQASTSQKIQKGSEDPSLSLQIKSVDDYSAKLKTYELSSTRAESRVKLTESGVQNAKNLISRAQSLVLQAKTATTTTEGRKAIGTELQGVLKSMVDVANTRDSNGEYIFSGMNTNQPAFSSQNGQYSYKGSVQETKVAITEGTQVTYNDSGFRLFSDIQSGNGYFSVTGDAVNNSGTGVLETAMIADQSQFVNDTYTITVDTHPVSGKSVYQVSGANSGQVIPALPGLFPDDAPEYQPGEQISFQGISVKLSGEPQAGDTFSMTPSSRQSVFETLQNIIDSLSMPMDSAKNKADFEQAINEQMNCLGEVETHLSNFHAEVGARANVIDREIELTKNRLLDQQILRSKLSEVDMTETLSMLTQSLSTLELTQKSYTSIQQIMNQILTG